MPGRDGKGPIGKGPMTGSCSGICILRIPDNQGELVQGYLGEAGWTVSLGGEPEIRTEVFEMPRGDGTGPAGTGPRSGRMRGICMCFGSPDASNRSQGMATPSVGGGGKGRRNSAGLGFGRGSRGVATPDSGPESTSELETLKAQAGHLEEALDGIKQRIERLGAVTEKSPG